MSMSYLSLQDAARELGVSRRTIQRYIQRGWIHVIRITPRNLRISRPDFDKFISNADQGKLADKTIPGRTIQSQLPF
jgi:excisionase family DNA binding protein